MCSRIGAKGNIAIRSYTACPAHRANVCWTTRALRFRATTPKMFPPDRAWLTSIGAQSFLAIPLCNEEGKVHGHLAVLDRRERDWGEVDFEILRIFSVQASAELGR